MHWGTIKEKVGKGKKAKTKSETVLEIQFSGSVSGSGDLAAYAAFECHDQEGQEKRSDDFEADQAVVGPPRVEPTTTSVALVLAAKPKLSQTDELQITAADLTDPLGRPLDGNGDGEPGGDFVGTLTKNGLALLSRAFAFSR